MFCNLDNPPHLFVSRSINQVHNDFWPLYFDWIILYDLYTRAYEGHVQACANAKYYGNAETYNILKGRGAKVPKTRKTPMTVANPREVPKYELNPLEL
ncbi:unnamed protein product [Lactuca saligna]|uniref:Uncharacterized protein n=1 Tax=Lactuca saligna TaxID=75948 RepID=A0AA35VX30_LACSI|nr:unnamed protein product [Lactuca saligna]